MKTTLLLYFFVEILVFTNEGPYRSTITINFSRVRPPHLILFDAHQRSAADTFCMLRGSFAVLEDASLIGLSHAILESHQYKCPASHLGDNPKTSL